MSTNNRHVDELRTLPCELRHKLIGPNAIQSRHTDDLFVIKPLLLVELSHRWHNRIHRVHNESKHCFRTEFCTSVNQALCNVCIDLKQVITCLARHACRNQHQVAASQALLQVIDGLILNIHDVTL